MEKSSNDERKRRTRQHVIASLSQNYVERFILELSHTVEQVTEDYGYDLILFTYDKEGFIENGNVFIQLKATENIREDTTKQFVRFRMGIRDYYAWLDEPNPVYLILYEARRRRAFWLYIQQYFEEDIRRRPRVNAKSVTVKIPMRNRFNRRAVEKMRKAKEHVLLQTSGLIKHHD